AFWDARIRVFEPSRAAGGSFYYSGTTGLFALALRWYIDHVARARKLLERVLGAGSLAEQVRLYEAELRPRLLRHGLLSAVGSPGVLALVGVPGPQRDMVRRYAGGIAAYLRACLDRVMSLTLLRDNYFWSVYLTGRYERESCPEYLRRPNFEA